MQNRFGQPHDYQRGGQVELVVSRTLLGGLPIDTDVIHATWEWGKPKPTTRKRAEFPLTVERCGIPQQAVCEVYEVVL